MSFSLSGLQNTLNQQFGQMNAQMQMTQQFQQKMALLQSKNSAIMAAINAQKSAADKIRG